MKRMFRVLAPSLIITAALLNACTDDQKKVEDVIAASPAKNEHEFSVDKDGKVTFKAEIVYFKYDDYSLTQEGMERLNVLANYLKGNKDSKLRIEGHCDERGSTEYNLALGELRAQSVRKYLATLNVPDGRLDIVSFGEEKPAAQGPGESSWAQNRRAEFTFLD